MKKLIALFAFLMVASVSINAQTTPAKPGTPSDIKFESKTINYGEIEKGANGVREFKFTNTGTSPLLITKAKGSCGCTVPTYPKEPIMPGESNVIKVKYDTKGVGKTTIKYSKWRIK